MLFASRRVHLRVMPASRQLPFAAILAALLLLPSALAASTPITLQLDWKANAQFAGILVAKQKGFYTREGLDVRIVPTDADINTVPIVAGQPNTIGIAEADILLVERAKGYPVRAFATLLQTTPFSILTLKSSGLANFKSLKGKRIGLYGDGEKAIDVLLHYNGMVRSDVTIVKIPLSVDPLITGQVDAMQGYVVDEAVQLEAQGHPINIIAMSDNGYVSYAEVLFTSSTLLKDHPDALVKFLRATREGWLYAIAHPGETAALIVEKYQPGDSVTEQRESLGKVIPLLNSETRDDRIGMMRPATWDECVEMFNKYQLADRKVALDDLVDYSILDRLYGRKP